MAKPFLEHEGVRAERRQREIAEAVEAYLAKRAGDPIPGMEDVELPEPLEWVWRLDMHRELYGTVQLRAGGYLDQPAHASRDIETAYLTYKKWQSERPIGARAASETTAAEMPPPGGEGFLNYLKDQ